MRTTTLDAAELGIPTDSIGVPSIFAPEVRRLVAEHAPWACRYEKVVGGIRCWESADDHRIWRNTGPGSEFDFDDRDTIEISDCA